MWPVTFQKHWGGFWWAQIHSYVDSFTERGKCGQTKTTFCLSPQKTGGHKWQAQQQSQMQTDSGLWAAAGTTVTQEAQEGEAVVSWPSWKLKAGKLFSESFGFENLRFKSVWFLQPSLRAIRTIKTMICLSGEDWLLTLFSLAPSSLARRSCGLLSIHMLPLQAGTKSGLLFTRLNPRWRSSEEVECLAFCKATECCRFSH